MHDKDWVFGELRTPGVAFIDVRDRKIHISNIYERNTERSQLLQTDNDLAFYFKMLIDCILSGSPSSSRSSG